MQGGVPKRELLADLLDRRSFIGSSCFQRVLKQCQAIGRGKDHALIKDISAPRDCNDTRGWGLSLEAPEQVLVVRHAWSYQITDANRIDALEIETNGPRDR
jgi:hypothetical protein